MARDRQLVLADRESELIVARLDLPGTIADTLRHIPDREISCAEMWMSRPGARVPGTERQLEIQRYEFDRKSTAHVTAAGAADVPERIRRDVAGALADLDPGMSRSDADEALRLLWLNNERFVRLAPPREVAQLVWLFRQGEVHEGIFLHAETPAAAARPEETHVLFAVGNPPQRAFLPQVIEALNALDIGVRRFTVFTISTEAHPYFLGSFHLQHRKGESLAPGSELFRRLRRELFNTQILAVESATYRDLVLPGLQRQAEDGDQPLHGP